MLIAFKMQYEQKHSELPVYGNHRISLSSCLYGMDHRHRYRLMLTEAPINHPGLRQP